MRLLAIIAICFVWSVGSANAQVRFLGQLCITFANAACEAEGTSAGFCVPVRYTPPGLTGNPNAPRLSLFYGTTYAENYRQLADGNWVGTEYQPAQGTGIGSGGFNFPAFVRFNIQAPANLTDTTNFINFFGNIARFQGVEGCLVSFRGAVVRDP